MGLDSNVTVKTTDVEFIRNTFPDNFKTVSRSIHVLEVDLEIDHNLDPFISLRHEMGTHALFDKIENC